MKCKLSLKKLLVYFIIIYFVIAAFIFVMFINFFLSTWGIGQGIALGAYTIVIILFYILIYNSCYYEITNKYVKFIKFKKELIFFYNDIIYIDKQESEKHKTITFATKYGHAKYLLFDQKNILYPTMIKNCNNLISKEQLISRFPKINL